MDPNLEKHWVLLGFSILFSTHTHTHSQPVDVVHTANKWIRISQKMLVLIGFTSFFATSLTPAHLQFAKTHVYDTISQSFSLVSEGPLGNPRASGPLTQHNTQSRHAPHFSLCCSSAVQVLSQTRHGSRLQCTTLWT